MCCVLRNALLHTYVVTNGYLRYCCFAISSEQSGYSALTFLINKTFSPRKLPLTGYFLVFWAISVNSRDGGVGNPQQFSLNFKQVVLTMSTSQMATCGWKDLSHRVVCDECLRVLLFFSGLGYKI